MIVEEFKHWLTTDPELNHFLQAHHITFEVAPLRENPDGGVEITFYTGDFIGDIATLPKVGTIRVNNENHSTRQVLVAENGAVVLPLRTAFIPASTPFYEVFEDFFVSLTGEGLWEVAQCHYFDGYISPLWSRGVLIYSRVIETQLAYPVAKKLAEQLNQTESTENIRYEVISTSSDLAPYEASCQVADQECEQEDYKHWLNYKHWRE